MSPYSQSPHDTKIVTTAHTNLTMEVYYPEKNNQDVIDEITRALSFLEVLGAIDAIQGSSNTASNKTPIQIDDHGMKE